MTTLIEFLQQPLVHGMARALGWTLLHFCWQGAMVAAGLWCVLGLMGQRWSQARYAVACIALALMVALPLGTFVRLANAELATQRMLAVPAVVLDFTVDSATATGPAHVPFKTWVKQTLDSSAPWVPAVWLAGVILFVVRLNVGLVVARRLQTAGTQLAPAELQETFERLRESLGLQRAVRLMHSAMVQVPTVIGWLRPVVLIPASCLSGLSTTQVEAILCHELAHVRRHDYLVSVFQSVVEALLFYHPAVWWVSKQVRRERECCCDELAVANGGDVLAYARALSMLEERRARFPEFVLGANGGALSMRIRRLLGYGNGPVMSMPAAITLSVVVLAAAGIYLGGVARAQAKLRFKLSEPISLVDTPAPYSTVTITQNSHAQVYLGSAGAGPLPPQGAREDSASVQSLQPPYKQWLEQDVHWIITDAEAEAFKHLATDAERDDFTRNFWERRNPIPGSASNVFKDQYYTRIAYANEHFATSKPGWTTDRGHIYIAYGKPDDVQAHPSGGPAGSHPYEVWHYRSVPGIGDNVNLTFVDSGNDYHYTIDTLGAQSQGKANGLASAELSARILAPPPVAQGSALLFVARKAASQNVGATETAGVISGVVYDPTGALVPRAQVKATSTSGNLARGNVTDNAGNYSLMGLPPGTYTVEVRAAGFATVRRENVRVEMGKATGVNLKLSVGSVNETLAVKSAAAVETAKAEGPVPPPPPPAPGKPARVSAGVMAGNAILQPAPVYPVEAKAAHVQGVVVLHAVISKTGDVKDLAVVSGPPELMVSSIDAVRQWKYKPYLLNGEPTAVETTISINYSLGDGNTAPDAKAGPEARESPVKAAAAAMASNVIYQVPPVYPPMAKAAGVQGPVVLRAIISKEGTVNQLTVLSGPPMLTTSALDAVRQWKYKPYLLNGQPTAVDTTITVNYSPAVPVAPKPEATSGSAGGSSIRISPGVAAAMVISRVNPVYPVEAKAARIEGVVVLSAVISKEGDVMQLTVVSGPPMLTTSALDAVRQWKYKPYLLNGQPVNVATTINVTYSLPESSDGNTQSDIRKMADGATTPVVIYQAEPKFTDEARKAKFSGVVLVNLVVDQKGIPRNVHVLRGVGMGLDKSAVDAVRQYRFKPAILNDEPKSESLNVEVNFQVF